jgi:exosortase
MTSKKHRQHAGKDRQVVNHPTTVSKNFGIAAVVMLLSTLFWAYWPVLVGLFSDWQSDDNYSVCQLVPLVAIYLIWRDKAALREFGASPCWWGLGLIVLALAARAYGLLFLFESAERYSFVLILAGLVLLVAGWRMFRKVFWILMFLFLMVPLPGRIHNMISGPMQNMATTGSVFLLEVFGVTVSQEGNTILLNSSVPLAVAEACSGLRMLTAFIVVAATMAFMVNRPRWQKTALVVSSIPIAIGCNLARLCVTAMLYLLTDSETAERFFHDFAGLTMMPIAVFILFGELWLMNKLVIPDEASASDTTVVPDHKAGKSV